MRPNLERDPATHRISITLSERQARTLATGHVSQTLRRMLTDLITFILPDLGKRRRRRGQP